MPTLFGLPAVPVRDADGNETLYLVRTLPGAWLLVKATGEEYVVTPAPGRWKCSCADFRYRRRFDVNRPACKHILAIRDWLNAETEVAHVGTDAAPGGRAGTGLPGTARGGGLPAAVGIHPEAPDTRREIPAPAPDE